MKHGSKTVQVDERGSFAGTLVTIYAEQGARAAEGKTARDTLPGKSRVGRILLNDNNSQNRLLEMKLADIQQMRRKAETFISHQQKSFIAKMEKRQSTWVREHTKFSNGTNLVLKPDERYSSVTPSPSASARETTKTSGEQEFNNKDNLGTKSDSQIHQTSRDSDSSSLPVIIYLTENEDSTVKDEGKYANGFIKEPEDAYRTQRMIIGLPPITHARKTGFQPSGKIDDLFDDKNLKKSSPGGAWQPRKEVEVTNNNGHSADMNFLPVIGEGTNANNPTDREFQDASDSIIADVEEANTPTPLFLLSHTLPKIEMNMPKARKHRPHNAQRSKVRRKRPRSRSAIDNTNDLDNPLVDERFKKLHDLLANEIVIDHETRELNALAEGLLAAKRFGRQWKK